MNDGVIQPGDSREKKANRNLAVGVGILGLGATVLFCAVLFFKPEWIIRLLPVPYVTDVSVSDGSRTYLVLWKLDLSRFDLRNNRKPMVRHFVAGLAGTELGPLQEIPDYAHAMSADNGLAFLREGAYRIFDGSRWVEERSGAIGKNPRGLLTPAGLYVLSDHESVPRLSLINPNRVVEIPLPAEYLDRITIGSGPYTKLAWHQGRLCLFWTEHGSLSWVILNGATWSSAATTPFTGEYEVASDGKSLYFFHREGEGLWRRLNCYVYTNDAWSGPMRLPIRHAIMNWYVFVQQGKLKIFVQQFMTQTLYTIEKGALVDPVRLTGPLTPCWMMGELGLAVALMNALVFLVIFGFSALIRRFKKRREENGAGYEYASLFRRFLARVIDNAVLLVPPAMVAVLLMPSPESIPRNPFPLVHMILSALALFFIGGFLYHVLLEGLCGRTLGKKLCGIRVLKADLSSCGFKAGFLRNLVRPVDAFFFCLVAVVSLAGTFKWQRVGDLAAGTVVVKEKR